MEKNIIKSSAKDIFLHLLLLLALYASVASFIAVWFQYANFLFPDKIEYQSHGTYIYDAMRMAMSILVVAFPIYLFVAWLLGREFAANSEKREGRGRRWLMYFTLFASATTIAVDLIALIYRFFAGDLATRFILKIAVVLVVAAAVLWYFIWDLKSDKKIGKKPKIFAIIISLVILASIIYGFTIMGTPGHQRDIRTDVRRTEDLQLIQNSVSNFWFTKNILPANLGEIKSRDNINTKDPQTGADYEYVVIDKVNFELCADFKTEDNSTMNQYYIGGNWNHKVGRTCFPRNARELNKGMIKPPIL